MKKNVFKLFIFILVGAILFLNCGKSKEEKRLEEEKTRLEKLKKEDPLFYDTNNEIIKISDKIKTGLSLEEFEKIFRIEDPSMLIKGRGGIEVKKHVIGKFHKGNSITYYLGDQTAVPPAYIAQFIFEDSVLKEKHIYKDRINKIIRYRKAIKTRPSAKPMIYNPF